MDARQEFVNHRLSSGYQYGVDFLAEEQDEFMQTGGRVDVRIKGIVVVLDGWLFEHMADQLRLPHSSGRGQQYVRPVFKCAHHPSGLFPPIAEIGLWDDACNIERILHTSAFWCKSKQNIPIIQIL